MSFNNPSRSAMVGHRKARYELKAKRFRAAHPICHVCQENPTEQVHHQKGRKGDKLLDDTKWLAVCNECHRKIHDK